MPLIDIQVMEGVFDAEDKTRIMESVARAYGEAAGGRMFENTSVRIHEVKSGDWYYAGNVLTTEVGLRIRAEEP
ncbi:MAG: tautomerase family protein [Paracoccaceae bacterium]|nr:tautomerase family protein [Paracoccaceae bacterium]